MWLWICAFALAGSEDWQLAEQTWVIDDAVSAAQPLSRWDFDDGYLFQVLDDGVPVGAVFVGTGTWTVSFEDPTDAVVTANRMAVLEGVDPASLVSVAAGGDLALDVDRGTLFGQGVWSALSPLLILLEDPKKLNVGQREGMTEVVVRRGRNPSAARKIAESALLLRTSWMRSHAFDPASLLAVDSWTPDDPDVWMVEMRTNHSWGRFAGAKTVGLQNRWLAYTHDESGAIRVDSAAQVIAREVSHSGRVVSHAVARRAFPMSARSVRGPVRRVDLMESVARHAFLPKDAHMRIENHSVMDLKVTAVGGAAGVAWLDVPHLEQQSYGGFWPMPNGWALEGIETPDGEPLEAMHLPMSGDQRDGRGPIRTYAVRMDPPLAPGETRVIRVRWRDHHRYRHLRLLDLTGADIKMKRDNSEPFDMGTATDLLPATVQVRTNRNPSAPAKIRVGVPAMFAKEQPLVGGSGQRRWAESGWNWVEGTTVGKRTRMAVGRFDLSVAPAQMGFPEIRTAVRLARADGVASEVRQILNLYNTVMPTFTGEQVQLAELVAPMHTIKFGVAGGGLTAIDGTHELSRESPLENAVRRYAPQLERWELGVALHTQYWDDLDLRGRDATLPWAMGVLYSNKMVGLASEADNATTWRKTIAKCANARNGRLGLVGGGSSVCAGAAVLEGPLAAHVGQPVVFEAVDRMLRGEYPASWEGLQLALEGVSGRSLDGFFDMWVYGGLAPEVEVAWTMNHGALQIVATNDLPFGRLTLPLDIETIDGSQRVLVDIVDGHGTLTLPWAGGAPSAVVIAPELAPVLQRSAVVAMNTLNPE